jgi:tetratricopeptide (TPR) repeat protein
MIKMQRKKIANDYDKTGVKFYRNGDFDSAIDNFSKAIESDPENPQFYNNLASAYIKASALQKNEEISKKHHLLDLAIENFIKANKLDPNSSEQYSNLGNAYSRKGSLDLAIENYTIAIKLNPTIASTFNLRGLAFKAKGKLGVAIDDFTAAKKLNPQNKGYSKNLENALLQNQGIFEVKQVNPHKYLRKTNDMSNNLDDPYDDMQNKKL